MQYYMDTAPWTMDNGKVKVVEDNEHLGQIVSGYQQELKNIDERISKGRKNLFGLLGPAYSYKCLLSPVLKMHLFRTYTCPIIRSGLSSFSLIKNQLKTMAIFHRNILKAFLNLSKTAATPAIHFVLGELPMEGKIHRDIFSLFYSVWRNPTTKISQIVKYLLTMSSETSLTWSAHLRRISSKYDMRDPLECLNSDPPTKSQYSEYVLTKITAYYEKELRQEAKTNSCMEFLNVNMVGLRGKHHPVITKIVTPVEVQKMRPHLKMLCGNLLTYQTKFNQSGIGSPHCRLCQAKSETLSHIIGSCSHYEEVRGRIMKEFEKLLETSLSKVRIGDFVETDNILTQFVLDPSSMNLSPRVHLNDPILPELFKLSRDLCFAINKNRNKSLHDLAKERQTKL